MNKDYCSTLSGTLVTTLMIGAGVTWFVTAQAGIWKGILYGIFWEAWIGYRLAEWLWR